MPEGKNDTDVNNDPEDLDEEVDDDADNGGATQDQGPWKGMRGVVQNKEGNLTLSQERMSSIMAKEKREGKRSAVNGLLQEYGFKDEDELKTALSSVKKKQKEDDDATSEASEAAAREKAEAAKEKREALKDKAETRLERALLREGAPDGNIAHLLRIAELDELIEGGITQEDVTEEARRLKDEVPQLFTAKDSDAEDEETDPKSKKPPASDPGKGPRKTAKGSSKDTARSILESRHPKLAKTN